MKIKLKNKNIILLFLFVTMISCTLLTGCEKREEFRHGHRHRIGDPPVEVEEQVEEHVVEEAIEPEPKPEPTVAKKRVTYTFEGLDKLYHEGMEMVCQEIHANKKEMKNFILHNSSGDRKTYIFDYKGTLFEVNFSTDGTVQYLTTVPADGLLYRDGCKGLDIADFCIDQEKIPAIISATQEAFEHGAVKSDFEIEYFWDEAQISRVYDYYIVRVDGKATYNYTERRTEPQIVCELKDFETVLNPRYFSVQNGERIEEFGQHEVPMCELEEK